MSDTITAFFKQVLKLSVGENMQESEVRAAREHSKPLVHPEKKQRRLPPATPPPAHMIHFFFILSKFY